ncbi:hypothetical protein [Macrococcus carouselicus]|uniref:Excalibur calcium-binding domain-containing protein n=1 Tax=Macrococcus carouselicus TaxID=69969 RepID=A0A9Q8CMA9_9STAP|nr:hypothetical protein [Macrococcus carouselicus]TDM02513.1 hypothetical protein ERX40_08130 [Macrococcus carouselicus]
MKQLMILILSLALALTACQQEEVIEVDRKPEIEVKVKTTETTETTTSEETFDTETYNAARECLLAGTCQRYTDTPEYNRAWNNLAKEGYLCQNGHCVVPDQSSEQTTETPSTETPTLEVTEEASREHSTTEVRSQPIKPSGLTTEMQPDVQP